MALIPSRRIVWQVVAGVIDGPDPDQEPDIIPAKGEVEFEASVTYIPLPGAVPNPVTVLTTKFKGIFDEQGYLCTPNQDAPKTTGYRGVRSFVNDDPSLSVKGWTLSVKPKFEVVNGDTPQIKPFSVSVAHSEDDLDLTKQVQVPSSPGVGVGQAMALLGLAQEASTSSAQSAEEAAAIAKAIQDAAEAGEFDGKEGPAGPNTVPTQQAVADAITTPGSPALTALSGTYAAQFTATPSTTVAQINEWLATPYAGVKRLAGAASINAPLIIPSDTTLDATGATISLTIAGHMVQNGAVTPLRTSAGDAAVTAGSSTVTSATGAFTAADIGRAISVSFVDATRGVNVYAKITAINSATSVTVDTPPMFTETGGTVKVFGRDKNIHIKGGKWNRQNNGGAGNQAHSLFLRRVDNSSVKGIEFFSQGGKYAVSYGDYTNVLIENHYTESSSDAMHFTGPGTNTVVRGVTGRSGDDTVPFTTTDYGAYNDCHGSFKNIHISDVRASPTTRLILLATSASEYVDGHSIDGIKVDNCTRANGGVGVYTEVLENDPNSRIDNLTIDGLVGDVTLRHTLHGKVTVNNILGKVTLSPDAKHSSGVQNLTNHVEELTITNMVNTADPLGFSNSKSTIGNLTIRGAKSAAPVLGGKSVTRAIFDSCTFTGTWNVSNGCIANSVTLSNVKANVTATVAIGHVLGSSTAESITYSDCELSATNTSAGDIVKVDAGSTVKTVRFARSKAAGLRGLLQNGGSSPVQVFLTDSVFDGCNRLIQGAGGAVVNYANVQILAGINTPFYATTGPLTLMGTAFTTNTGAAFDRSATEAVRVIDPNLKGDLSKLAKNNGDAAYNTNAALACGVGPAVSNGTNWKNTYSAAIY